MAHGQGSRMRTSSGPMPNPVNFFKEKLILQEEEKELKKMLEKFQDQLNRLKIEELALLSTMKMEKEKQEKGESSVKLGADSVSSKDALSVTSEEMKNYAAVGVVSEDPSVINQQSLDLNVGPSEFFGQGQGDEEEEMDSDEEEKQASAAAAAESYQLMSFMEDF